MNADLSNRILQIAFADPATLAEALAQAVADDLRAALAKRGSASLVLSGGNTPKVFMQTLARQSLDWAQVAVTLVDERWVPETSERSNAALLKANLLQGPAAAARFVPLYRNTPEPEQSLAAIESDLGTLPRPFDVLVLGMGNDGHTASFFPGGDQLAAALDPAAAAVVIAMRAPGAGEPRITLTLPPILAATHLYLHIEGAGKREVLAQAVSGDGPGAAYPIRSVLEQVRSPLRIYWSA